MSNAGLFSINEIVVKQEKEYPEHCQHVLLLLLSY